MKLSKLKSLRRAALATGWTERKQNDKHFETIANKVEDAYGRGEPFYEYQAKPGQVKDHISYWQQHPVFSKMIFSAIEKPYTKTNVTLVLYFKGI